MAFDEQGQARHYERRRSASASARTISHRRSRFPARGHHLRSEHPHRRHRHRGAQQLRRRFHRGDALDQGRTCRTRKVSGGVSQHFVLASAATTRVREAMHCGVSLPRDPGRHGHGHRQRRACSRFTRRFPKDLLELVEDVLLNRRPDATERLVELRREAEEEGARRQRPRRRRKRGATAPSRSGSRTRSSRASTRTSTRTPRKRAPKLRSTARRSSKAR